MSNKIANLISYIFHPLLIPTFAIILLFNTGTYLSYIPFNIQRAIYIIVFISTFILPLSFMPFFLYSKRITSLFLDNRRERIIPLIITVLFYFFAFYILHNLNAPKIIRLFMLGASLSVLFSLFVTFFWKISTHMIGVGGLLAITVVISIRLMVDLQFLLMIFILISGLVATSRLYVKAHDSLQVYAGIILGFSVTFLPFLLF